MTTLRRFQTPAIAVLIVLLATPAAAACCAWTAGAMPCCEEREETGVTAACCIGEADSSQQPLPASTAKLARADALPLVSAIVQPSSPLRARHVSPIDQVSGPPGSDPLYLRLSVIRR